MTTCRSARLGKTKISFDILETVGHDSTILCDRDLHISMGFNEFARNVVGFREEPFSRKGIKLYYKYPSQYIPDKFPDVTFADMKGNFPKMAECETVGLTLPANFVFKSRKIINEFVHYQLIGAQRYIQNKTEYPYVSATKTMLKSEAVLNVEDKGEYRIIHLESASRHEKELYSYLPKAELDTKFGKVAPAPSKPALNI